MTAGSSSTIKFSVDRNINISVAVLCFLVCRAENLGVYTLTSSHLQMKNFLRTIFLLRSRGQVRGKCTNNVNSYHLTVGSEKPRISTEKGSVTLVNMRFCPYAQRTVMCLNAKNVDYQVINCQLMSKASLKFSKNFMICNFVLYFSQNGYGPLILLAKFLFCFIMEIQFTSLLSLASTLTRCSQGTSPSMLTMLQTGPRTG